MSFRYLGGRRISVPLADVRFRQPTERLVKGFIRGRFVDNFTIVLSQLDNRDEFVEFITRQSSMARSPVLRG